MNRLGHLVRDIGGIAAYDLAPPAIRRLGRPALVRLANRLGDAVRRTSPRDAAIMAAELRATFGCTDTDTIVAQAWRNRMLAELEVVRYPTLTAANIDATAALVGREHLDRALTHGKGAIVMIGHFGANQLIMPALGHRNYPMNQISAPPTAWLGRRADGRENAVWRRVQARRHALEQVLPARHIDVFGFLRPAYTCLGRNEVLGLAFDGGGGTRWVDAQLGERTASIPTQPWQLARSTGAWIVPCTVIHDPDDAGHRVVLDEPWPIEKGADRDADVAAAASKYVEWFTARCVERPDHYAPYLLLRHKVRDSDARPLFARA